MNFQIEKQVEIPSGRSGTTYPFSQMEVNDSFLVPLEEGKKIDGLRSSVSSAATSWGLKNGDRKFTTRIMKDESGNPTGVRIWRVK